MAVTDVAHRYGIPVIIAEAGADDITGRGYPEVFRLAPSYSMLAQQPALWLSEVGDYNQDGVTTATVIAENSTTASALIDAVVANLVDASIETDMLRVDLPSSDFSSVVARLVAREQLPDAIFIYVKGQPALLLQSELLAAGIGPQRSTLLVQNHAGLNSAQFWKDVPDGAGTVVLRTGAWASTLTSHGHDFVIKYDQYAGKWPESYAFASYDAMCLLAEALRTAPSWKGSDLVTALEASDLELTSGRISFANSRSSDTSPTSYLWHQWADSQILYLQYTEADQSAKAMPVIWPPQHRISQVQAAIAPSEP
jgi:branched-chain amino acid transport system substrate-binding protein